MVRRDGTKDGLNASHMMLRVPTMYIWPSSVCRFDSHAQLMNICGVWIAFVAADARDKSNISAKRLIYQTFKNF